MHHIQLSETNKNKELNTIINIEESNRYSKQQIIKLNNVVENRKQQINNNQNKDEKQIWVTFTYPGNYIRAITNLFKHTNIKIAYKTTNTLGNLLKETRNINKYEKAGIYKLTCKDCHKLYIGETGRPLKIRYKERIRSIKYNKDDSAYGTHILYNIHQYGNIEEIMDRKDQEKKGRFMNIMESFYIYKYKCENKLIDKNIKY
jgi:hypothetical protein